MQEINFIKDFEDLQVIAGIKIRQIECLKKNHHRGFPLKAYVQKLKDNTITLYEFNRLTTFIEKINAKPLEEFYAK